MAKSNHVFISKSLKVLRVHDAVFIFIIESNQLIVKLTLKAFLFRLNISLQERYVF